MKRGGGGRKRRGTKRPRQEESDDTDIEQEDDASADEEEDAEEDDEGIDPAPIAAAAASSSTSVSTSRRSLAEAQSKRPLRLPTRYGRSLTALISAAANTSPLKPVMKIIAPPIEETPTAQPREQQMADSAEQQMADSADNASSALTPFSLSTSISSHALVPPSSQVLNESLIDPTIAVPPSSASPTTGSASSPVKPKRSRPSRAKKPPVDTLSQTSPMALYMSPPPSPPVDAKVSVKVKRDRGKSNPTSDTTIKSRPKKKAKGDASSLEGNDMQIDSQPSRTASEADPIAPPTRVLSPTESDPSQVDLLPTFRVYTSIPTHHSMTPVSVTVPTLQPISYEYLSPSESVTDPMHAAADHHDDAATVTGEWNHHDGDTHCQMVTPTGGVMFNGHGGHHAHLALASTMQFPSLAAGCSWAGPGSIAISMQSMPFDRLSASPPPPPLMNGNGTVTPPRGDLGEYHQRLVESRRVLSPLSQPSISPLSHPSLSPDASTSHPSYGPPISRAIRDADALLATSPQPTNHTNNNNNNNQPAQG